MTHRFSRIALFSTLVAAMAAPALAQQPTATISETVSTTSAKPAERADAPQRGHRPHHAGRHQGGPHGDALLRGVTLTDAQKDQVFAIRHAAMPAMRDAMKAGAAAQRAVREQTLAANFDEARVEQLAREAADARIKATVLRAKTDHQVLAVLTPEQRAQFDTRRQQAEERRQQRRDDAGERGSRGPAPTEAAKPAAQ